jgi:hypothetical protein
VNRRNLPDSIILIICLKIRPVANFRIRLGFEPGKYMPNGPCELGNGLPWLPAE